MINFNPELKIFNSTLLDGSRVVAGFGTRMTGDGKHQIENIFKFFGNNSIDYRKIVIPEQIHSVNIDVIRPALSNENLVKVDETDGVITNESGVALTVVTADCCPIIFADSMAGIIGISHQGWRGSVKRMVQKMIDRMQEIGSKKENIKAVIGPAIGQCCYDIDEDRYYEFREEFDGYEDKIFRHSQGSWHLSLNRLNYLLLLEKGLKKENIDFFPFCTKCDKLRFFSFRRDKKLTEGEMFSFAVMMP